MKSSLLQVIGEAIRFCQLQNTLPFIPLSLHFSHVLICAYPYNVHIIISGQQGVNSFNEVASLGKLLVLQTGLTP